MEDRQAKPLYFPVSLLKLSVLSLFTFGMYELYWFYKNFQLAQERRGGGRYVEPILRTVFVVFTAYGLFKSIARTSEELGGRKLRPGLLLIAWLALYVSSRLPSWYGIASFGSFLPILPIQAAAREVNARLAPECDPNERFTIVNVAWCIVPLFLAILAGALGWV